MDINWINLPGAVLIMIFHKILNSGLKSIKSPDKTNQKGLYNITEIFEPTSVFFLAMGAAIGCITHYLKNRTSTNIPRKCAKFDSSLIHKIRKRKWLEKNRSWILRDLFSTKENRELALKYLATQIPYENEIFDDNQNLIASKNKNKFKNPKSQQPDRQTKNKCVRISKNIYENADFKGKIKPQGSKIKPSKKENPIEVFTPSVIKAIVPSKDTLKDFDFKRPRIPSRNKRLKTKRLSGDSKHSSSISFLRHTTRTRRGGKQKLSKRQKIIMF